jgi:hypothetical protein
MKNMNRIIKLVFLMLTTFFSLATAAEKEIVVVVSNDMKIYGLEQIYISDSYRISADAPLTRNNIDTVNNINAAVFIANKSLISGKEYIFSPHLKLISVADSKLDLAYNPAKQQKTDKKAVTRIATAKRKTVKPAFRDNPQTIIRLSNTFVTLVPASSNTRIQFFTKNLIRFSAVAVEKTVCKDAINRVFTMTSYQYTFQYGNLPPPLV